MKRKMMGGMNKKMAMSEGHMMDNRMMHDNHQQGIERKMQKNGHAVHTGMHYPMGKETPLMKMGEGMGCCSGKMKGHAGSLENWKRTGGRLVPREA